MHPLNLALDCEWRLTSRVAMHFLELRTVFNLVLNEAEHLPEIWVSHTDLLFDGD